MINQNTEKVLKMFLETYKQDNKDYWSFRGNAVRKHAHAFMQYPAMMVPQMQGELIEVFTRIQPNILSIYDPYMGSGTVMTEAMLKGLNFAGQDINPLSLLICKVKQGPFHINALKSGMDNLIIRIENDQCNDVILKFDKMFKWFRYDVSIELSKIYHAIKYEDARWKRRFFWLALAETVRLTSNSRTSTFKLHVRPKEEIDTRRIYPRKLFVDILNNNFKKLIELKSILGKQNLLKNGFYKGKIEVKLMDSTLPITHPSKKYNLYDLLITSPPYGDNTSTVPYGQYSYLPLQWIDLEDIDNIDKSFLSSTMEIDRRSIGGIKTNAIEETIELQQESKSFHYIMSALKCEPKDRAIRVAAFFRDLSKSMEPILLKLKPGAFMIWIVGNRKVANLRVPTDDILSELLINRGAKILHQFHRKIPAKRMAIKNSIAQTMSTETILIVKKSDN